MTARPITTGEQAASCYFRTTADHPHRKALVQICEPCNTLCSHCFVSATKRGTFMSVAQVRDRLIPALTAARVTRVTVTGGEPFVHEDLIEIVTELRAAGFGVGVCTNGTGVSDEDLRNLDALRQELEEMAPTWISVRWPGCHPAWLSGRYDPRSGAWR